MNCFITPMASDEAGESLRDAAMIIAHAATIKDMQAANAALASGMQTIGLDRWNRTLRALAERAQLVLPPLERAPVRLWPTMTISEAPYQVAAIDFDPRDVQMSPAAEAVDALIRPIALRIIAQAQNEFDGVSVQSAASTMHKRFADAIKAARIPGVSVETSFKRNGNPASAGELGSVRTDVIFENPATHRVEGIWDWKIGGATLTARRANQLVEQVLGVIGTSQLPDYRITVVELHIDWKPGP